MTSKKKAILLINTGSPDTYKVKDVRRYLRAFLSDPRVLSIPKLLRLLLVNAIIAPLRGPRSAQKYETIWMPEGAPLKVFTERLAEKVEARAGLLTTTAMRYTEGSFIKALDYAEMEGVTELIAVPLFPHYAKSSYESIIAHLEATSRSKPYSFRISTVAPYFAAPVYIEAVVEHILQTVKAGFHLLFSYHGIPVSQTTPYIGNEAQDYEWQCHKMTKLIMAHPAIKVLNLTHEISFQSRFGTDRWLTPATKARLECLPIEGFKDVAVICPSFVCDCLETIEEIGIEGRESFLQAGGETFSLIPCPNDSELMVSAILEITQEKDATPLSLWTAPQKR